MTHTLKILWLTVGLCAVSLVCGGSGANLKWNSSGTNATLSYTLYGHTNTITATNYHDSLLRMNCGTNLTAKASGMTTGIWNWAVTATIYPGIESDLSNVLVFEVPPAPGQLINIFPQYTMTLTNAVWRDIMGFRLRIESPAP